MDHSLTLTRDLPVPREKLYRCWTEPELLRQWFCPRPWGVSKAVLDVRPGGASHITMQGPAGEVVECPGVYLEVVPNERLVTTDAYVRAWEPGAKPFMTAVITFEDLGGGRTRYTATAKHWSAEDRARHEALGFHEGWGRATDQLAELAATL